MRRFYIIFLILVTLLVYASSLQNLFVWDDYLVIVENDFVKSWQNFPSLFNKAYLMHFSDIDYLGRRDIGSGETSYRPLVTISYFFDYHLWKLNPMGYHITNLFLHILNSVLLFILIDAITKKKKIALLASLLFALHPINAEAVNVISFREDLLAFLFYIISFIFYVELNDCSPRKRFYFHTLSLAAFFLALFSKEMSISLPLILILYDYFFIFEKKAPDFFKGLRSRYTAYFIVAMFYIWIRFFVMINISDIPARYAGGSFYTNFLTMSRVLATYIQWVFFPVNIYSTLPDDIAMISYSLFNLKVLFSISLVIACIVIAVKIRIKSRQASFAIFWFFMALLPVSNIFPLMNYMASRYLYIPAAGFCFLVAIVLTDAGLFRKYTRSIIVALLVFYSIFTIIRSLTYKNNIVFWWGMTESYPENAIAHSSLGSSFKEKGILDRAISEYCLAISLDPYYAKDCNNLGVCYYKKHLKDEAVVEFKKALKLDPNLLDAYVNLGSVLGEKGLYEEAIAYFEKALKLDPAHIQAYNSIGVTYARMEKYAKARKAWEKALEIDFKNIEARNNLKKLGQLHY